MLGPANISAMIIKNTVSNAIFSMVFIAINSHQLCFMEFFLFQCIETTRQLQQRE